MGFEIWLTDDAPPVVLLTIHAGSTRAVFTFNTVDEAVAEAKVWLMGGSSNAEQN